MPIKCSVFIAASLDGFIAKADGDIAWLVDQTPPTPEDDYGYKAFFDSVDALVMGRITYEAVLAFPEWPYADKKVFVLSHGQPPIPPTLADRVEILSVPPQVLLDQLEKAGYCHLYVDGGQTIQGFLQAGLINEITLTIIPILLGGGIPLFGSLKHEFSLELLASRSYANGFVQNHYRLNDQTKTSDNL